MSIDADSGLSLADIEQFRAHLHAIDGILDRLVNSAATGLTSDSVDLGLARDVVEFASRLGPRSMDQVRFFGSRVRSDNANVAYLVCQLRYDRRKGRHVSEARHTFRLPAEVLRALDLED